MPINNMYNCVNTNIVSSNDEGVNNFNLIFY